MSRDHATKTYGPPGNEEPVEVATDIQWSNALTMSWQLNDGSDLVRY